MLREKHTFPQRFLAPSAYQATIRLVQAHSIGASNMAYGRLEVYWPDGRLETHFLNTETVSVGRADGNTIALDTDAISRYHLSITKAGDDITLTDLGSQNGTYVDGVRLESNKPHLLGDVEEIQVGS